MRLQRLSAVPTVARRLYSAKACETLDNLNTLKIERPSSAVVHIQLNRPKAHNAFTPEMWSELHQAFDHFDVDRDCRSIVLSGNGPSFCAGIDLKLGFAALLQTMQERSTDAARRAFAIRDLIKRYQDSFTVTSSGAPRKSAPSLQSLERCRKPVIVAIHSHCLGAATSLITAADVRFASSDAQMSVKEVDVGLAADVGVLQRIQRVVGNDSWTREIVLSARTFGADEALNFGLVSRVLATRDECVEAALALAAEIATKSPIAVAGSKLALNHARNNSTDASLEWIVAHNAAMLQTEDSKRIAMARAQKRQPQFDNA